jgi:hypothetical protein
VSSLHTLTEGQAGARRAPPRKEVVAKCAGRFLCVCVCVCEHQQVSIHHSISLCQCGITAHSPALQDLDMMQPFLTQEEASLPVLAQQSVTHCLVVFCRVVPACDEGKWPPEFNSPHTIRSDANSVGEGPEEVSSLPQTDLEEGSSTSGVLITPRTGQTLKAYCRLSAAGLSNMLDASRHERLRRVFTSINPSEVIATRMPLSGASVQPFFQALGLMISIFFFVMGVAQWASMSRPVHPSYAHFRIHTLETRNGTLTPLSGWGVGDWGFQEWGVLGAGELCALFERILIFAACILVRTSSRMLPQIPFTAA